MDILVLVLLLLMSAAFSGSETAFFALTATEREALRRGSAAARGAAGLIGRANDLLSAILLGNLVVNVAIGAVTTRICLREFGTPGLAVAVPAATILLLIVGEITPKLIALERRQQLVLVLQGPLRLWVAVTGPLVRTLTAGIEHLLRRLPWERTGSLPFTTAELQTACDLATSDGQLTETEGNFLARLLQLEDLDVRNVMTPRPDVVLLDRTWDRTRILATVERAGFNRYPVVEGGGAMPMGVFHTKDLLTNRDRLPLQVELRPLLYAPETKDVAAVLAEMRAGAGHLAAVVDEHGDFTGVVTLADCLHALIGRVGDPGGGRPGVLAVGPSRWLVDGGLDLRQFHEEIGLELPPARDYVTVAGYVMASLGRIPARGDVVVVADAELSVVSMQGHRVESLLVTRVTSETEEPT